MAKISANYEVVYIIDPAQSEEAIAATVAKFQTSGASAVLLTPSTTRPKATMC